MLFLLKLMYLRCIFYSIVELIGENFVMEKNACQVCTCNQITARIHQKVIFFSIF